MDFAVFQGSSPHTRGARFRVRERRCLMRIIPAYAGSTMAVTGSLAMTRDHPRIRGEHKRAFKNARIVIGSSPHTRGAHAMGGG